MRRDIYIVVDLALLRGPDRDTNLANFISAVARTWATYHQPDISFGYTLYDSSCGEYAVNHYIQKVASELSKLILNFSVFISMFYSLIDIPFYLPMFFSRAPETPARHLR